RKNPDQYARGPWSANPAPELVALHVDLLTEFRRRSVPFKIKKTDTTEADQPRPSPRGRGRSRFTATQEYSQLGETTKSPPEPSSRRLPSRKRIGETTERRTTRPLKTSYEVEEVVNESPIDSFRRQSKPRVLTETHFESVHAPKRKLIDPVQAVTEAPVEDLVRPAESNTEVPETSSAQTDATNDLTAVDDVADTTFKTNSLDVSSEISRTNEITKEFTKTQPITTPRPTESRRGQNGARRSNIRSRTSSVDETATQTAARSRSRSVTRPTRRPEETATQAQAQAAVPRATQRGSRRRPESSTPLAEAASRKGPSVFVAEETQEISRVRPGRRIGPSAAPERITLDLPGRDVTRKRTSIPAAATTSRNGDDPRKRNSSRFQSRNLESSSGRSGSRSRSRNVIPSIDEYSTASSKGRFRARDFPPIIDEQKLEVLPLFETEPKTVAPVAKPRSGSRARTINHSQETIQTSATENDVNFTPKANETPTFSVSRTVNVETRTETSTKRKPVTRRPVVKESVIAEVSEVTSKRTVTRRLKTKVKAGPKGSSGQNVNRGKKKSEVGLVDAKKSEGSSEEIDESDNYPEPFKALIQAKKGNKKVMVLILLLVNVLIS
ncbi:hypothetical protein NQ315_002162, partial [Exocentrus adspersus]